MRVVLSMPNDGQSNNYIINALQDEGHEVVFLDHRSYPQQAAKQLPEIMKAFQPDLFLCLYLVNGQTYPSDFIDKLKTHFPSCTYAAWLFDITINGKYAYESPEFIQLLKSYDLFFTVARGHVDKFKEAGIKQTYWVPEGYCPYSHIHEFDSLTQTDILFCGQFGHPEVHKERLEYLDAIADLKLDLKIFGHAFGSTPKIDRCYMYRPTHNDVEHCREVRSAKINLCHSGWADVDGYVSARNYRVSAAGGLMFCNDGEGVRSLWEPNKEVVLYSNVKDCIDKIRHYVSNEKERNEISEAGQKKTLENYSFRNSIRKITEIIE